MISTLPGALGAQEAWEVLAPSERFLGFRLKTEAISFNRQLQGKETGWSSYYIYIGSSLNTYRYLEKLREGPLKPGKESCRGGRRSQQ